MLKRSPSNLPSVRQHATIVEEHVVEERAAGRLLGPLPPQLARLCHTSPIGLIPKPHQPGRWRLIVGLSSPHDGSVNNAISIDHCRMHYASVLHAAAMVRQLGPGTMLAKIDRSNSMSVVHALASGAARDPLLMHLLRCLHFFTACHQIGFQSRHIAGVLNTAAVALSRDNLSTFYRCIPQVDKTPSPVPVQLLEMLLHQRPDWTSHSWRRMFLSSLDRP